MKNQQAFTLIELLVVVLIIGILAAVALPQYQKAVDKSHIIQGITLLSTLHKAQEMFYLSQGKYSTRLEDLDIEFPTTCSLCGNFDNGLFCPQHSFIIRNSTNSATNSHNPGGIGIAFCPGETEAENCYQNDNSVHWYLEHHITPRYRNMVYCLTDTVRSKPLCDLVKQLANKQ